MTDDEIKKRIKQLLEKGSSIRLQLPFAGQPGGGTMGMCSIPAHICPACEEDKPKFEFNPPESRICLHDRCYRLWIEVETRPWTAGS